MYFSQGLAFQILNWQNAISYVFITANYLSFIENYIFYSFYYIWHIFLNKDYIIVYILLLCFT